MRNNDESEEENEEIIEKETEIEDTEEEQDLTIIENIEGTGNKINEKGNKMEGNSEELDRDWVKLEEILDRKLNSMIGKIIGKVRKCDCEGKAETKRIKELYENLKTETEEKERYWEMEKEKLKVRLNKIEIQLQEKQLEQNNREREQENTLRKEKVMTNIPELITKADDRNPEAMPSREIEWEIKERKMRRKNIIIKGLKGKSHKIKDEARKIIQKNIGVDPTYREIKIVSEGLLIKLNSMRDKLKIIGRRRNLLKKGIKIEDDLTPREREVQQWIEDKAKEEEYKDKNIKIGYMRIMIENEWYIWDEEKGCLKKDLFRSQRKEK